MPRIKQIATDVATLMGETLALECRPEETPFPGIEEMVRIRAPILLGEIYASIDLPGLLTLPGKRMKSEIIIDKEGSVTLPLPDDFLRLQMIKMSDWSRPLTELTENDSAPYIRQGSRWKGIRGTPERPVAVIGRDPEGKALLKLYSSSDSATLETALYLPIPTLDVDDLLDVPQSVYGLLLSKLAESIGILRM